MECRACEWVSASTKRRVCEQWRRLFCCEAAGAFSCSFILWIVDLDWICGCGCTDPQRTRLASTPSFALFPFPTYLHELSFHTLVVVKKIYLVAPRLLPYTHSLLALVVRCLPSLRIASVRTAAHHRHVRCRSVAYGCYSAVFSNSHRHRRSVWHAHQRIEFEHHNRHRMQHPTSPSLFSALRVLVRVHALHIRSSTRWSP